MKKCIIFICCYGLMQAMQAQNIIRAEYFVDTDAGVGLNTLVNIPAAADATSSFNINLQNVPIGYHKLYIRTLDNAGNWSITMRRNIEIVAATPVNRVIGGEYFIDTDPEFGKANAISVSPQDSVILQNFQAVTSGLAIGYHKFYIRLRDTNGNWSNIVRRNIEIDNPPYSIGGAEYYFNNDPGIGSGNFAGFTGTTPADRMYSFFIPLENIPTGAHILNIRVKDNYSTRWSQPAAETDSVVTTIKAGNWSDPTVWSSNKVPDANTVVILHHNITIDIDAACKSLAPYRHSVQAIMADGKKMTITGHSGL